MLREYRLDFARIDVKARHQNHVFFAIDDFQRAIGAHHRDVAGFQPAVLQGAAGFVRVLPVALHHLRPAHPHFPRLAQRHDGAVVVAQGNVGAGHGVADGAVVGSGVHVVDADQRRGFGQAVAFDDDVAGERLPVVGDSFFQRHAASNDVAQAREVQAAEGGVVQQGFEQGIDAGEHSRRVAAQDGEEGFDVARVGDQHGMHAAATESEAVNGAAKDMVKRQRGDDDVAGADIAADDPQVDLRGVGEQVGVTEHRPFGDAGGAAGVLQHRHLVGFGVVAGKRQRASDFQQFFEGDDARKVVFRHQFGDVAHVEIDNRRPERAHFVAVAGNDDVAQARHLRPHFSDAAGEVFRQHDAAHAAVVQLVLQLARGVERVDVHRDHARQHAAVKADGVLQDVRHHQREAVAGFVAKFVLQEGGESAGALGDVAIGQGAAEIAEGGAVGVAREHVFQKCAEVFVLAAAEGMRYAFLVTGEPGAGDVVRGVHELPLCWFIGGNTIKRTAAQRRFSCALRRFFQQRRCFSLCIATKKCISR